MWEVWEGWGGGEVWEGWEDESNYRVINIYYQDLRRTAIFSRGEWHSPPADSVLPKNLRKS
ncbi:hypothetical protein [Okeania sp. SIO3I5]|uniref:hypothetical protein n=1 Tax=Okeania sp. SIO3I5 TaxID=2607805 RepID=UPI0025E680E7|nr:hypothetical protein [Okeania sp. SIO3I5]